LCSRVVRHVVDPQLGPASLVSGLLVAALFVFYWLSDLLARRRPGPSFPLALWLVASCAAVSIALAASATVGQLAAVLAAGLGAFTVIGFFRPALSFPSGGVAVVTLVLGGLLPL